MFLSHGPAVNILSGDLSEWKQKVGGTADGGIRMEERKRRQGMGTWRRILCLFVEYAGGNNMAMLIFMAVSGTSAVLQVYVVSRFIDAVLESVTEMAWNGRLLVLSVALILTVSVDWLGPGITRLLQRKSELALEERYRPILLKKCAGLAYCHVEQSDSMDLINRVLRDTGKRVMEIYMAGLSLLKLLIQIAGILFIIAGYVWWAALLILIFCIPLFWYSVRGGKKNYEAQRDTSKQTRKYQYLDTLLVRREYAYERNLFGYSDRVGEEYQNVYRDVLHTETNTQVYWAVKTKISGALSAVAALLIIATLLRPTVAGTISIGLFISLVNAVFQLTAQMSWGLSRNIDALVTGNEFAKDMEQFWRLDEEEGARDLPVYPQDIRRIEFRNVSFGYPGEKEDVLRNVSFSMERGKSYAFVGANGAGKTTAVKLLTGLYSGYRGEIWIDGRELREYTGAEQKGIFSVVYQDFIRHSLTLGENCQLADPCGAVAEGERDGLFRQFGLSELAESLPDGYDTLLGKVREGGVDLSGGQWQKLTLVRALLRPSPVRILDEPTASLDPQAESEIYRLFQSVDRERLTLLISHRLGFAKLVDRIFVFAGGEICEQGDFDFLMEKRGLFREMYEEQRSWYE